MIACFWRPLLRTAALVCLITIGWSALPSHSLADDLPDDVERQIDEQTEGLPDEIREQAREKIKEELARRIAERKEQGLPVPGDEDEESDDDESASEEESEEGEEDEAEEEEQEEPAEDPASEEAKKLKAEMELDATRFKYRVAQYEKQIEEQRLQAEKSKIDRKLEAERVAEQMAAMQRDVGRIKLEAELTKMQSELAQAKLQAELAQVKAEKERMETAVAMEDLDEKLENRILGDEQYPDEPFQDGVLHISLRRIELNGPIYDGAADYVCQRLDYFNNQSDKPIFLVIDNCPGGSAIEGMQIVQAIERSKAPVHVVVKRFAASMAAIITTLADHSYCYPDAIMLHHQASSSLFGNGRDMEDQKRQFNEISRRLIGAVAEKIGTTEEEFVDQMYENRVSGDWELFGDQACEKRWVDAVAHTIREDGVRTRPTGARRTQSILRIFGESQQPAQADGYLERYEVALPEETDERGRRYVRLPRLTPVDVWLLYNPDGYYRN